MSIRRPPVLAGHNSNPAHRRLGFGSVPSPSQRLFPLPTTQLPQDKSTRNFFSPLDHSHIPSVTNRRASVRGLPSYFHSPYIFFSLYSPFLFFLCHNYPQLFLSSPSSVVVSGYEGSSTTPPRGTHGLFRWHCGYKYLLIQVVLHYFAELCNLTLSAPSFCSSG